LRRVLLISLLSAAVTLRFSSTSCAETPLSEHFKYVADAANHIHFLAATAQKPEDHAKEIAEQACKMLMQLNADQQFKDLKVSPNMDVDLKKALLNISEVNNFVDKEEHALNDIGVDRFTSIEALAAAIPFAKTFDTKKIDAKAILQELSDLQNSACSLVGKMDQMEHSQKVVRELAFGAAGTAIVVGDGVAAYVSAGSAALFTSASLAIGG
jgi:hypothetical protein